MRRSRLSALRHLCSMVLVLGLVACASVNEDITAKWSVEKLREEAQDSVRTGAWDKAIQYYDKLEGRAAGTLLSQQAQLEKAHAQYKFGERPQALATLDRFIRLHPASPALDYAFYLKGLINFNDNLGMFGSITRQDLSERDQKAAKDSYEAFRELSTRFPDSRYAADARQRMVYIVNSLAMYEVHVARYYASRGAHVAAIGRAQQAINDYPNVPAIEEALAILVYAHDQLGMTQLRDDARRVLQANYPKSAYLKGYSPARNTSWFKLF